MEIKQVFKTSKGLFWTLEEASTKKNREKDTDPYSPYFGKYEEIQFRYVLVQDNNSFALNQIQVI